MLIQNYFRDPLIYFSAYRGTKTPGNINRYRDIKLMLQSCAVRKYVAADRM